MTGMKYRESCRAAFIKLNILTLASQCILSLMNFMINNLEQFTFNCSIYKKSMRYGRNLHVPQSHLATGQKGTYYMSLTLFNSLPDYLVDLVCDKQQFIKEVRHFTIICLTLLMNSHVFVVINSGARQMKCPLFDGCWTYTLHYYVQIIRS
jgi:hypothetical protein